LWRRVPVARAEAPEAGDVATVRTTLEAALADIDADPERDLRSRLGGENRQASARVREVLARQWQG
ncbi:biotin-independent malonate decarboxylase subunit gamma, partial [Rhizobiaceae sp. 2RAB30]